MSKVIVITGANRGIGLALTKHYLAYGNRVYALCREASAELEYSGAEIVMGVDLGEPDTFARMTEYFAQTQIDLLINNAGIHCSQRLGSIDYEEMQQQFTINAVSPLRLTEALLPSMSAEAKVALITSRMGSIEDNGSGASYAYRMSKCALNAAGKSLAIDLKPRGVAVAILHPGFVQTEMVGYHGDITPELSAERLAQRIEELNLENTGTFWHSNGQILPW